MTGIDFNGSANMPRPQHTPHIACITLRIASYYLEAHLPGQFRPCPLTLGVVIMINVNVAAFAMTYKDHQLILQLSSFMRNLLNDSERAASVIRFEPSRAFRVSTL